MRRVWISQCPVPSSDPGSRPPARQICTQKLCVSVHVAKKKKLDDTTDRDYRYTAATPLTLLEQLTLRLGTGPRPGHSLCTLVLTVVPIVSIALYVMPFTILVCVYLPDALVGSCPRHSTRSRFTSPTAGVPAPLSNLSIVRGTYTTASATSSVLNASNIHRSPAFAFAYRTQKNGCAEMRLIAFANAVLQRQELFVLTSC